MCESGKREFKNPRAARSALTKIDKRRQRVRRRREQAIYLCPLCRCFHLTSEPLDDESERFR